MMEFDGISYNIIEYHGNHKKVWGIIDTTWEIIESNCSDGPMIRVRARTTGPRGLFQEALASLSPTQASRKQKGMLRRANP